MSYAAIVISLSQRFWLGKPTESTMQTQRLTKSVRLTH